MNESKNTLSPSLLAAAGGLLILLPAIFYSRLIILHMANIPFHDDYEIILNFMNQFLQAGSTGEKLSLLFSQHNEHHMVFGRVATLLEYALRGEINLNDFLLIGNLGWAVTIVILIWIAMNQYQLSFFQAIPIPFVLLIPTHWETMVFPSAVANYWVIVFSLLFIICLIHNRFAGAIVLYLAALLTFGNGLVLGVLGLVYLGFLKRWRSFITFGVLVSLSLAFISITYTRPVDHPSIVETLTQPGTILQYIVLFWGSISAMKVPAFFIGTILMFAAAFQMLRRPQDHFLILMIMVVALTSLAAAVARSGFGVEQALSSRNSLYALLIMVCSYLSLIASLKKNHWKNRTALMMLLAAGLFWYSNASRYDVRLSLRKSDRITGIVKFMEVNDPAGLIHPDHQRAAAILSTADSLQVYHYRTWDR